MTGTDISDDPVWTVLGVVAGFILAVVSSAALIASELLAGWAWSAFLAMDLVTLGIGHLLSRERTTQRFGTGMMAGAGLALVAQVAFALWVVLVIGS